MQTSHRRIGVVAGGLLAAGVAVGMSGAAPAEAKPGGPVFGAPINLGASGGEPSIQDDGRGHVYITGPNGIFVHPNQDGVDLWRSNDGGKTFLPKQNVGGLVGGGDSDVMAERSGSVYVTDLGGTHANIQKSTDFGATWSAAQTTGYLNDRQWLTSIGPNALVLTYHDFVNNAPVIYKSTDGGANWAPAGWNGTGQMIPPTDPGFAETKCNTLVSKPVVDGHGAIYVLINTTTAQNNLQGGCAGPPSSLERLLIAVSHDGGTTFSTHLASDLNKTATGRSGTGSWGHVFNQLGIDAEENLYIDASATIDGTAPLQNYLLMSKDHGATWSQPLATNPSPNAQLFPAIATGQDGEVAVGYYQGTKPDHHATGSNFQFVVDQTFNALSAHPHFTHTQLQPKQGATTVHPDGICTDGLFCGTPLSSGGNRNLADFESMAVDPQGRLEVIIPADADGSTTENWFYKQTSGPRMEPGMVNGNGTGNQTWVFEDDHSGDNGDHGGSGGDGGSSHSGGGSNGGGGGGGPHHGDAHSIRSS
jgi:uncharacterized membrane protein YgcG